MASFAKILKTIITSDTKIISQMLTAERLQTFSNCIGMKVICVNQQYQ